MSSLNQKREQMFYLKQKVENLQDLIKKGKPTQEDYNKLKSLMKEGDALDRQINFMSTKAKEEAKSAPKQVILGSDMSGVIDYRREDQNYDAIYSHKYD